MKAKHQLKPVVLRNLPGTCIEIALRSGLSLMTVRRWVKILHEEKAIYIAGWKRPPVGRFTPRYAVGNRSDVPCKMVAQTRAESSRKRRAQQRRNPILNELVLERQAARMRLRRAKSKGKINWLYALMQPATRSKTKEKQ